MHGSEPLQVLYGSGHMGSDGNVILFDGSSITQGLLRQGPGT